MTELEASWLAGLLEGEGSFNWYASEKEYGKPTVKLAMTDFDIVERAAKIMGAKTVKSVKTERPDRLESLNYKPMFKCIVSTTKAAVLMEKILPYMGERRSAKIKELLDLWIKRPGYKATSLAIRSGNILRWDKQRLQDNTLNLIHELSLNGMSQYKIADKLNTENVPTRTGVGKWSQTQVGRTLRLGRPSNGVMQNVA
jgi:Recombinase